MSQIRGVRRPQKNQLAKAGFFVLSSLPLPLVDKSPSVKDACGTINQRPAVGKR